MKVTYTSKAMKSLRKIPQKDAKAIMAKLDRYAETGEGDVVNLTNLSGYRLRHGMWRAFFTISDDILVVRVAKRGDAY